MGWLENKISGIQIEMEEMATNLITWVGTIYTRRPDLLVDTEAGPVGVAMDALLPYTLAIIIIVTTWSLGANALDAHRGQRVDWGETIGYLLRNFVLVSLVITAYGLISRALGEMSVAMINSSVRDTDFIENMKLMILLGGDAPAGMMALSLLIQGSIQGLLGFLLFAKDILGVALLAPLVFVAAISHGRTGTGLFNNVVRIIAAILSLDIFIALGLMTSYSLMGADLSAPGGFEALALGTLFSAIQLFIPLALATLIGMPSVNVDSLSRMRNGAGAAATRYLSTRIGADGKAAPAQGASSNGSTPSTPARVPATTPSGASKSPPGAASAPGMSSRATTTNLGSSAPGAASKAGVPGAAGAAGKAAPAAGATGVAAGGAAVVGAAGVAAVKSTRDSVNAAAPSPVKGAQTEGSGK